MRLSSDPSKSKWKQVSSQAENSAPLVEVNGLRELDGKGQLRFVRPDWTKTGVIDPEGVIFVRLCHVMTLMSSSSEHCHVMVCAWEFQGLRAPLIRITCSRAHKILDSPFGLFGEEGDGML